MIFSLILILCSFAKQNAAVRALKHFTVAYFGDGSPSDATTMYLDQLSNQNVAVRRGSALGLGVLPYQFLATKWKDVLIKLCGACAIEVSLVEEFRHSCLFCVLP